LPTESPSPSASKTPTIRQAIDDLVKSGETSKRSIPEYARMLERFAKFFGEGERLGAIGQDRFAKYAAHVKVQDAWADKTKNTNIVTCARLFNRYAGRNSFVGKISTTGLKIKRTRPASQDRDAFTVAEIKSIFANATRYRNSEPCRWWISVVPAFLGCRIEELAQAHLAGDVYRDTATGAMVLNITEDKADDAVPSKSVKTFAGWRKVPIHPVLEEAGFIRFLDEQRAAGHATPFASQWAPFTDRNTGGTVHSHSIVKWGGRELKKLRAAGLVGADSKLTYFHSMRHAFVTILTNAGIGEEWRAGLAGQVYGGINAQVYSKAREDVSQTLPMISAALDVHILNISGKAIGVKTANGKQTLYSRQSAIVTIYQGNVMLVEEHPGAPAFALSLRSAPTMASSSNARSRAGDTGLCATCTCMSAYASARTCTSPVSSNAATACRCAFRTMRMASSPVPCASR
jgi:hypothetical protein